MVDINAKVYSVLSSLGYPTYYQYPDIFTQFPCISYFDSGHTPSDYEDGKASLDEVEITVDVWEKADISTGLIIEAHLLVDKAMMDNGFFRFIFVNQFEENTKITHYTLKYRKIEEEEE